MNKEFKDLTDSQQKRLENAVEQAGLPAEELLYEYGGRDLILEHTTLEGIREARRAWREPGSFDCNNDNVIVVRRRQVLKGQPRSTVLFAEIDKNLIAIIEDV